MFKAVAVVDSAEGALVEEGVGDVARPEEGTDCAEGLGEVGLGGPEEGVLDGVEEIVLKDGLSAF